MKTAFYQLIFLGLWLSGCTAQEAATTESMQVEATKPNVEIFRCLAEFLTCALVVLKFKEL